MTYLARPLILPLILFGYEEMKAIIGDNISELGLCVDRERMTDDYSVQRASLQSAISLIDFCGASD